MTQDSNNKFKLRYTIDLFKAMVDENLGYIYRGNFSDDIADSILELTEKTLHNQESSSKIKKRVYAIMVEGLQNITRHQDVSSEQYIDRQSVFVIQRFQDKYYITTGNIIEAENIEHVKHLIEKINALSKDELKVYYKQVLKDGSLSEKGGAGLGLIDMAKKSGNKLSYFFKPLTNDLYYFYLHTIPTIEENVEIKENGSCDSLDKIIKVHDLLNKENALLIFNGMFYKDSYSDLLQSFGKNISENKILKDKLFYIVIEMLQNIVKYGERLNIEKEGNPGIFYLSKLEDKYIITTGNYILNNNVKETQEKIQTLNAYSTEGLKEYYMNTLMDRNHTKPIGLVAVRKEANSTVDCNIKR
jgi:hypothetical protein